MRTSAAIIIFLTLVTGCSTTARFKIPEGTELYLANRAQPVTIGENGIVRTRPYFWSSIAGIHYRLEKDHKVVQEGHVAARFRPVSIFWPPYALIYWPVGFNRHASYDLTGTRKN